MIRKRNNEDNEERLFSVLNKNNNSQEKAKFKRDARESIFKMSREAAELLAENSHPFAVVIADTDNHDIHVIIGMAGNQDDAITLHDGIKKAHDELTNNLIAVKLGITPDKVAKFRELMEEE